MQASSPAGVESSVRSRGRWVPSKPAKLVVRSAGGELCQRTQTVMRRMRFPMNVMLAFSFICSSAPNAVAVDDSDAGTSQPMPDEQWAIHGQTTYVEQETDSFRAPYSGPNSLSPDSGRETVDATLYFGARLWSGAEGWINPEIDQGFGLDNTLGVAGFPSGEAYKIGKNQPYLRLPRAFVRQTLNMGDATEAVEGAANQLGGTRSADRWVFTFGKFAVTDVFDTNQYAHDPRADFLNWSAVDAGSFDYAADAWGFTVGVAAERYVGSWTLRAGLFDLSNIPNSAHLDPGFHEFQIDAEVEKRYELFGQTGRVLITAFDSRGRMGLLDAAIQLAAQTGGTPNPADVRQYRSRLGASLDLEQPITADLGVFARVGKAAGNVEVYEFTDIDRTVELGASLKGLRWHRPDDTVGVAAIDNGISAEREQYLNAGGLGVLVGDGQLPHPGAEQIVETYYSFAARSWVQLSVDYQWVKNPGYNTDRGPVSIVAVRLHAQF
jgi:high affinity Mn2+ porin